jgi:hypothetical protein
MEEKMRNKLMTSAMIGGILLCFGMFLFLFISGNKSYYKVCLWGIDNQQYCENVIEIDWGKFPEYNPVIQKYYPPSSYGNLYVTWGACVYDNEMFPPSILCNKSFVISSNIWMNIGGPDNREFYLTPLAIRWGDGIQVREEQ